MLCVSLLSLCPAPGVQRRSSPLTRDVSLLPRVGGDGKGKLCMIRSDQRQSSDMITSCDIIDWIDASFPSTALFSCPIFMQYRDKQTVAYPRYALEFLYRAFRVFAVSSPWPTRSPSKLATHCRRMRATSSGRRWHGQDQF